MIRQIALALSYKLYKSSPQKSLLFPVRQDRNCAHFAFAESWDRVSGWFEVKDRLLDIGGEVGEVDDLRYAGAGDSGDTGDLGLVFDLAGGE